MAIVLLEDVHLRLIFLTLFCFDLLFFTGTFWSFLYFFISLVLREKSLLNLQILSFPIFLSSVVKFVSNVIFCCCLAIQPGMSVNVGNIESEIRVWLQHCGNQIFEFVGVVVLTLVQFKMIPKQIGSVSYDQPVCIVIL